MHALNASELLDTFTAAGLVLSLTPDNALKVTPARALNDEWRATIKTNKAMLVDYLQHTAAKDSVTSSSVAPDRWYWPHSTAMNTVEIEAFTARLETFAEKGVSPGEAEVLADKLVTRDREGDDRRLCLECPHLQGHVRWHCGAWQAAIVAREELAPDLIRLLQRCDGFNVAAFSIKNFQMISENPF